MNIQDMDYNTSQYFNPNVQTWTFLTKAYIISFSESNTQMRGVRNQLYQDISIF